MELATGALGTLLPKLGNLLRDECNLQKSVKKDIQFLSRELEATRAALRDVGEVPPEQLDELVEVWARSVSELSYDTEDIIDTFLVRVEGPEPHCKKGAKRFIKKMVEKFTKATTRHRIAQEIKDIKERLKEVAERRDRYKVDSIRVSPPKTLVDSRITALYKTTNFVGIDEARKELITTLMMGDDTSSTLQKRIVSIVGFGGLGKTTLAKMVYDELRLQFECKAFVFVSRNPDTTKLLKDMLYQLDEESYRNIHSATLDEKHLIDRVRKILHNKRYFIVIDDMWGIEPWSIISCALAENNKGSRIIITTRIIGVAKQVGHCYMLKPLTHENSEILFYGRIFGSKYKCPEQFSEVSENILKKCGGVPLAIITTSSLLANKLGNVKEWYQWCASIGFGDGNNNHDMENMRKILSLSYYDLPSHLKTCLLYISIFPEDYKIHRDRLIWTWIAEDFVQRQEGSQSLFELGESYFNELLNRSLIQPACMDEEGTPMACRVHDMVLDLICSLSRKQNFVTTLLGEMKQNTSLGSKVRRLSLQKASWPTINMSKLRSLTIFNSTIISMPSLSRCHLLRVLDLQDCNLKDHPSLRHVGNLFHLRYMGLRNTGYAGKLPVEIVKLQYLQILDLRATHIKELPSNIVKLRQLVCLYIEENIRLPNGLRNLTSLEVLRTVSLDSAYILEELGHLTQLRTLSIELKLHKKCRLDRILCKALVKSLGKLHNIQALEIFTDEVADDLEGLLKPLGNLHLVHIYRTDFLPTWIDPRWLPLLSYLNITLSHMHSDGIHVLGMLQALRYLRVEVTGGGDTEVDERFMARDDAFPRVTRCIFYGFATVPSMFPRGAMPRLEQFKFSIQLEDFCSGVFALDNLDIDHLPSLQSVTVYLYGEDRVSEEVVDEVAEALENLLQVHPNHPSIKWRLP